MYTIRAMIAMIKPIEQIYYSDWTHKQEVDNSPLNRIFQFPT